MGSIVTLYQLFNFICCKDYKKDVTNARTLDLSSNGLILVASSLELYKTSLVGLQHLKTVNVSRNSLKTLNGKSFLVVKKLNPELSSLDLSDNCLEKLNNESFTGLEKLKHLNVTDNLLEELNRESFYGLKYLSELNLQNNKIQFIGNGTFQQLKTLKILCLRYNSLREVNAVSFVGPKSLTINLESNMMANCTFTNLREVKEVSVADNNVTYVNKIMFKGMRGIKVLNLEENKIKMIESGAFRDLVSLRSLNLSNNALHSILKGTFLRRPQLHIDLQDNDISKISWNIYQTSSSDAGKTAAARLKVDALDFRCKRHLCWMKQLNWQNVKNKLRIKCDKQIERICPSRERWCKNQENIDECKVQCKNMTYLGARLVTDEDVCPFQYFCSCKCFPCAEKCALQGKVANESGSDIFGCSICNCQCKEINCWKTCYSVNFKVKNDTFGCPVCECLCPYVNCDARCSGRGQGITKNDTTGCPVCDGCKSLETDIKSKIWKNVVVAPALVLLICLCSSSFIAAYLYKRQNSEFEHDSEPSDQKNKSDDIQEIEISGCESSSKRNYDVQQNTGKEKSS